MDNLQNSGQHRSVQFTLLSAICKVCLQVVIHYHPNYKTGQIQNRGTEEFQTLNGSNRLSKSHYKKIFSLKVKIKKC